MRTLRSYSFLLVFALFGGLLLTGCDDVGSGEAEGRVQVRLTDAPFPFDLVAEANVTIDRVELLRADSLGTDALVLSDSARSYNLLTLRDGVTELLAERDVEAGTYRQLRLIVADDAEVVLKDGTRFDLKIPSGTQTGIKVTFPRFEVDPDETVTLTVDFDVSQSFVVQGNPDTPAGIKGFHFKPVLKAETLVDDGETMELDGTETGG